MNKLALTTPGNNTLQAPGNVPTGGLRTAGSNIFATLLSLMFIAGISLALIFLILGGIRWITSRGDPKAIEGARKQITFAIIGLIIVFAAFAIVQIIGGVFNVHLLG